MKVGEGAPSAREEGGDSTRADVDRNTPVMLFRIQSRRLLLAFDDVGSAL